MKILVLSLSFVLTACGSNGTPNAPGSMTNATASPFQKFQGGSNASGIQIDFSQGSFNQAFMMTFKYANGAICQANVTLSESNGIAAGAGEDGGVGSITGATYVSGGSGDPGCSNLNSNQYTWGAFSSSPRLMFCNTVFPGCLDFN